MVRSRHEHLQGAARRGAASGLQPHLPRGRFGEVFTASNEEARALSAHLHERLDEVFNLVDPMLESVAPELDSIGMDRHRLLHELSIDARERLDKSIAAGRRLAQSRASEPQAVTVES